LPHEDVRHEVAEEVQGARRGHEESVRPAQNRQNRHERNRAVDHPLLLAGQPGRNKREQLVEDRREGQAKRDVGSDLHVDRDRVDGRANVEPGHRPGIVLHLVEHRHGQDQADDERAADRQARAHDAGAQLEQMFAHRHLGEHIRCAVIRSQPIGAVRSMRPGRMRPVESG
jgi:hypothetical protein